MKKENVQFSDLLEWDNYLGKNPSDALKQIYSHVSAVSQKSRNWYWSSIRSKKYCSLSIRGMIFILVVCGAVLPILAGLSGEAEKRLIFTQLGVTSLAISGLLYFADEIFGWSTGWLRYMTTALAMDDRTRKFELDWADYMINKTDGLNENDKRPLFILAKQLEDDISKMQSEETDKWATEFNKSTIRLGELIKSQRESADKAYAEEKEKKKAQDPGAIELTITNQSVPLPIKVAIDDNQEESFTGTVWSKLGLVPGLHQVRVNTTTQKPMTIKLPVNVIAGGIAKMEVTLP